ncbi:uracil-DNA glycosylase [Devosia nitrariae]|uniref:Type-4 uracil-DNA glycosylase n=1 Tax=Devosia nitrariae TaxID=2071872 RepID=A0ABQ5W4P6_9HYPH|nr:uracil-DNA glycosylase [Devosia nitrariae]GLQ54891.1 uracil-DNA glycosylase [Devosia nitrariae]
MAENQPHNRDELISVLDWYRAAGVDTPVGEEPVDRFAQQQAAMAGERAQAPAPQPRPPAIEASLSADPSEARALAAGAQTLDELRQILHGYDGCGLKFRATQLVFADGNPEAEIMLIGEAPGADEDRIGRPFVGRSGQLLDRMLAAIGLDRTKVYIANTVPWRPPGNRNPSPEEMALCLPFLNRQVELVAPKVIVSLGGPATKTVFGTDVGILKMRGKWGDVTLGGHKAMGLATLHPAYLLRTPSAKQQAWRDLLSLQARVEEMGIEVGGGGG